jgi:hypothetical protein
LGLYNMIFGRNTQAPALLAVLGFKSTTEVGRFRDAYISDGEIAVYTRNGGGNRQCWHDDNPEYGSPECKHHVITVETDEIEEVPLGKHLKTYKKTGRKVEENRYVCENPNSPDCGCSGCIITHRLPKHAYYLRDQDDSFDSTYATIYFSFPPEYAEDLKKLDSGEKFDPDARWQKALEAFKQ